MRLNQLTITGGGDKCKKGHSPRGDKGRRIRSATGPTDTEGPAGPPGATGAQGAQGEPGPTGPTGPTGVAGADGVDGEDGGYGPTGATGVTGAAQPFNTYRVVSTPGVVATGEIGFTSATCDAGDVLAGGGEQLLGPWPVGQFQTLPDPDSETWLLVVDNSSGCAPTSPRDGRVVAMAHQFPGEYRCCAVDGHGRPCRQHPGEQERAGAPAHAADQLGPERYGSGSEGEQGYGLLFAAGRRGPHVGDAGGGRGDGGENDGNDVHLNRLPCFGEWEFIPRASREIDRAFRVMTRNVVA